MEGNLYSGGCDDKQNPVALKIDINSGDTDYFKIVQPGVEPNDPPVPRAVTMPFLSVSFEYKTEENENENIFVADFLQSGEENKVNFCLSLYYEHPDFYGEVVSFVDYAFQVQLNIDGSFSTYDGAVQVSAKDTKTADTYKEVYVGISSYPCNPDQENSVYVPPFIGKTGQGMYI